MDLRNIPIVIANGKVEKAIAEQPEALYIQQQSKKLKEPDESKRTKSVH